MNRFSEPLLDLIGPRIRAEGENMKPLGRDRFGAVYTPFGETSGVLTRGDQANAIARAAVEKQQHAERRFRLVALAHYIDRNLLEPVDEDSQAKIILAPVGFLVGPQDAAVKPDLAGRRFRENERSPLPPPRHPGHSVPAQLR